MGDVDESPDAPDTREVHIVKGSDPNHPLGDASVVFGESKPDMYVGIQLLHSADHLPCDGFYDTLLGCD